MNLCFVDIETTGLDAQKHEIIEIGAIHTDGAKLESYVLPSHIETADPESLAINGYTEKGWQQMDAITLPDALQSLNVIANGAYFIAYNATFDWSFLQKAYSDYGIEPNFHYHRLDLMTLVWGGADDPPLSLREFCLVNGLETEPSVHRAINGAKCALAAYKHHAGL